MADEPQTPSGPTEGIVTMDELPAFPQGPVDKGDVPNQDTGFIMDTLFGESPPVPSDKPNSGEGQAQGSTSPDAQTPGTPPAPPSSAPAANGGDGSPQPGPSPTPAAVTPQAEPAAGGAAPQTPAPGTVPAAAPTPAAPELDAETRLRLAGLEALRAENARLREEMARAQQPQQPGGQTPAAPGTPSAQPEQLQLRVPNDLIGAIFNEDANIAAQGMNTLISALATTVMNTTLQRVEAMLNQRFQAVDEQAQQLRAANDQEAAYYEAFPAHENELYRPVIAAAVDELYKELPHLAWDQQTIAAVGQRVNNKLLALGINVGMVPANPVVPAAGGQPQQPAGTVPANGAQRPAPMLDSSTRGGGGTPVEGSDFIRSTFG